MRELGLKMFDFQKKIGLNTKRVSTIYIFAIAQKKKQAELTMDFYYISFRLVFDNVTVDAIWNTNLLCDKVIFDVVGFGTKIIKLENQQILGLPVNKVPI